MSELTTALRGRVVHGSYLVRLPPPVMSFYWKAWRRRAELDDVFSLGGATKPRELLPLLKAARGARQVVEVGTGTGWTTLSLALANPSCEIVTFDVVHQPERDAYLDLVDRSVTDRIEWVIAPGEVAPVGVDDVDFLFIDAAHDYASTVESFEAWKPRLSPGATVAFHDYDDPQWPGVTEAIRHLGIEPSGEAHHHLFVWRNAG
jgi:predicted O-methyltransferase YrrM